MSIYILFDTKVKCTYDTKFIYDIDVKGNKHVVMIQNVLMIQKYKLHSAMIQNLF